jgi:GLPGLI family protein
MFAIVIPPSSLRLSSRLRITSALRPSFRSFIPVLLLVGASLPLTAQSLQGTIFYERKIDVHRHIDDEQMKAMVPQFQTGQYELFYRDSVCVYNVVPHDEAPDPFDNQAGGNRIVMRFNGPGDAGILYRNFTTGQLFEQTTLADVEYIITDTIRSIPWKLSTDTLTILGHLCKKATATGIRNNIPIVAWYCEDILLPVGPDRYGGLPGAILKLDMDNGGTVFTATRLSPAVDVKSLKAPSGKMITRAAFEKKMDEILGPADSQGHRMIRN